MNNKIKLLSLSVLCTIVSLHAVSYEYGTLYKDTRVMGMGGANVALGGESSAVFYNPAGLSGMDPKEGLELELANLSAVISGNSIEFVTKAMALNVDGGDYSGVSDFLGSNTVKEPISLGLNDYSSVAYRADSWAFTVGVLAGANAALQIHNPLGTAGVLEANGATNTGLITGFSMDFLEDNSLHVGLGAKVMMGDFDGIAFNNSVKAGLTTTDIAALMAKGADPVKYLTDKGMLNPYSQVLFDMGAIYDLDALIPFGDFLHPSVALSYLNIGNVVATNDSVVIPQTVNFGFALRPDIFLLTDWLMTDWVFTADFVDALYAYDDGSFGKRLRMGARMSVIKGWLGELTASAGMYNANWTAGAQLRVLFLDVMFATYAEELGAFAGQDSDRRYQLSLAMGF